MNKQILDLVFKKYWNNQELTTFEATALEYYLNESDDIENNYFNKLATINF